jgi:hypothetical protein
MEIADGVNTREWKIVHFGLFALGDAIAAATKPKYHNYHDGESCWFRFFIFVVKSEKSLENNSAVLIPAIAKVVTVGKTSILADWRRRGNMSDTRIERGSCCFIPKNDEGGHLIITLQFFHGTASVLNHAVLSFNLLGELSLEKAKKMAASLNENILDARVSVPSRVTG